MNKIRTVASRLNAFLNNGDLTNSPTLQNILADYIETCKYVNERLSRCELLLEKDKAGEALLSAERVPSLFEIVPLLQSPDLATLFDICATYHLPSPPVLKTSVFKLLEKAQAETGTMANLLAELRKLARTPGNEEKVIVLRKIAALEPDNPEWKKQIKQAESICVPEMIDEAQNAITNNDFEKLEELNEALSSPAWQLVIPEIVIEKIHKTLEKERQRQLRLRAKEILTEVDKAYSEQNLVDFLSAKNHWKMLCEIDKYLPSGEESKHFSAAEAFFGKEQDRLVKDNEYSDILRQMNALIRSASEISFPDVEEVYNRLTVYDRPVPQNIVDFVSAKKQEYVEEVKHQSIKRGFSKAFYSFVLLAIVAIGCICTWYSYQRKQYVIKLTEALNKKDTDRASELVSEIEKSLYPYLKFSSRLQDLQAKTKKITVIEGRFAEAKDEFEQLLKSEINEENILLLEGKLSNCKEYAKTEKTEAEYVELEKKFNSSFVDKLKEIQNQRWKSILADMKRIREDWREALKKKKFVEAEDIIRKVDAKIAEFEKLNYLDKDKISKEDIELLEKTAWIKELHVQLGNSILTELKNLRIEFRKTLKNEKYSDAYDMLNKIDEKISECKKLEYFDKDKMSKEDIELLEKMNWVIERHYSVFKNMQSLVEGGKFDEALDILKIYEQDEEEWPELASVTRTKYEKAISAKEMKKEIEHKKVDVHAGKLLENLKDLQKQIDKSVADKEFSIAENWLADYRVKLEEGQKLPNVSQEIKTALKSLRTADEIEKTIIGQKMVADVYELLKDSISQMASINERELLLKKITLALDNQTIASNQKEQLKALKQQITAFGKICDYQSGLIKTHWDNINYEFFYDLAEERLWNQKEAEILGETKQSIESFVNKCMAHELYYFSFRDSKLKIHSWLYSRDELTKNKWSTKDSIPSVTLKIRNETIFIEGDKVTVTKEIDGDDVSVVYKNVKFLSPSVISEQSINESRIGYQVTLPKVQTEFSALKETFFSESYYSIIASLKSQEQVCVPQRLELYKLLLSPFVKAKEATYPIGTGQIVIFDNDSNRELLDKVAVLSKTINDMLDSVSNEAAVAALEEIDDKYKAEIARLDFAVIEKLMQVVKLEHEIRSSLLKRRFTCVGLAVKQNDGNLQYIRGIKSKLKKGEVWALTSNTGSILAGISDGQQITWNENINILASILFVPEDSIDTVNQAADYRNKMANLGVSNVAWPRFFPENLTK